MKTTALIKSIHQTPQRAVLVIAGAGTTALASLLEVAGASNTLLEAIVPYQHTAFVEFLGNTPQQHVSATTSRKLAGVAFQRAIKLEDGPTTPIGVSCTATIATTRKKRGKHRAHIAFWSMDKVVQYALYLEKGKRSRKKEEALVAILLLNTIAESMSVEERLPLEIGPKDRLERTETNLVNLVTQFTENKIDHFGITADGRLAKKLPSVILSGAFNPLHEGHIGLAKAAMKKLNRLVSFECAAINADKAPLTAQQILIRLSQFAGKWPVFVSNAPTFVKKSLIYPGAAFVVGYDTAVRILDPRYYNNDLKQRNAALSEIWGNENSFWVAGRTNGTDSFLSLSDIPVPAEYHQLFHPINEDEFRLDISSTEIRRKIKTGAEN